MRQHLRNTIVKIRSNCHLALFACLLAVNLCGESSAVFWRADWPTGDPQWRTSYDGLMTNVGKVNNGVTEEFGSGVLIHEKWMLTVEHVVSDDDELTGPADLSVFLPNYGGTFSVSEVHSHSSGDIALLKLSTEPTDWIDVPLNDINDEVNKILEVGGYGYFGPAGDNTPGIGTYHRAQNRVDTIIGTDLKYDFDAPGSGAIAREGISDNGDSGGPVLLKTSDDQWVLGALTRAGSGENPVDYGKRSWAIKTSSYIPWIQSLVPGALLRSTIESAAPGDLNFDSSIDNLDLELLLDAHGKSVPEVVDNYDLFDDGVIDATPQAANSDLDAFVHGILDTDYGDANLDGSVDHDDLLVWQAGYALGGGAWATGDSNVDGRVDGLDFLTYQQNYTGSGSGSQSLATTVPEPTSVVLVCSFLLAHSCRRRKEWALSGSY